jgi:RNA polymerase sigma factor (sigma-70 family)
MSNSQLVCIVDDDPSVRDSLSLMLGLKGFDCRTYASSEAFLSSPPQRPACLILDLRMTGQDGLALQKQLKEMEQSVTLEVIFLTAYADIEVMRQAFLNDAIDFLEKPVVLPRLLEALEKAFERLHTSHQNQTVVKGLELLTPREREVLKAVALGHNHREIGQLLGISPRTVEVHKGRVMEKLAVKTLAELLRLIMTAANNKAL